MIIGNDKERVRKLEIRCKLAEELIKSLRDDMEKIAVYLRDETDLDTTDEPLWKIWSDIGRCSGHLNSFK